MYYTRLLNAAVSAPSDSSGETSSRSEVQLKYDPRYAIRDFDFTHLIDYRNVPLVRSMAKGRLKETEIAKEDNPLALTGMQGKAALFDFAAAVVTQLHYRSHVHSKEIITSVDEFFHQSLIEAGYSLCALTDELKDAIQQPGIEMVIPGAQTHAIWKDRVDAAILTLETLAFPQCEVNMTFTGRCPEGGGRILNEAGDMLAYFEERRSKIPDRITIRTHREGEAQNTRENIERSFEQRGAGIKNESHFFFVSSLFHLPRLGKELSGVLKSNSGKARQITLVSPKKVMSEPEPSYHEATYIKSAMFEFFQKLLFDRIETIPSRPGYGT